MPPALTSGSRGKSARAFHSGSLFGRSKLLRRAYRCRGSLRTTYAPTWHYVYCRVHVPPIKCWSLMKS